MQVFFRRPNNTVKALNGLVYTAHLNPRMLQSVFNSNSSTGIDFQHLSDEVFGIVCEKRPLTACDLMTHITYICVSIHFY